MRGIDHLLARAFSDPWAIIPGRASAIIDVLARRAGGTILTAEEIEEAVGEAPEEAAARRAAAAGVGGGIAVLPVYGVIANRAHDIENSSGPMTSAELVQRELARLQADPSISTIVLDIDSPGGTVGGVPELAAAIMRSTKPVVAVANAEAASAAYWIASAADELVVPPSGEVGSIGVWALHQDFTEAFKMRGVKPTMKRAGKFKAEFNPWEPLSAEAGEHLQARVDDSYKHFVKAVADGRGVTPATVRNDFGEGRMVRAEEAVRLGMADRVATLDETLARLLGGGRVRRRERAEAGAAAPAPAAPVVADPAAPGPATPAAVLTDDELALDPEIRRLAYLAGRTGKAGA